MSPKKPHAVAFVFSQFDHNGCHSGYPGFRVFLVWFSSGFLLRHGQDIFLERLVKFYLQNCQKWKKYGEDSFSSFLIRRLLQPFSIKFVFSCVIFIKCHARVNLRLKNPDFFIRKGQYLRKEFRPGRPTTETFIIGWIPIYFHVIVLIETFPVQWWKP